MLYLLKDLSTILILNFTTLMHFTSIATLQIFLMGIHNYK